MKKKSYKYESYMCPTTPESFLYDAPVKDPKRWTAAAGGGEN